MLKKLPVFFFLILSFSAKAQDDCNFATSLCASFLSQGSTLGATMAVNDPGLDCGDNTVNNSVWFTMIGIANGTATITVSGIDSLGGLEMEVYTGTCGSLAPIAGACSSATGPAGSMTVTIPVSNGNTYFIMVDGTNGTEEAFDIIATATNDAIVGAPHTQFTTNVLRGCTPLTFGVFNQTQLFGGSNITYSWQIDAGATIPSSGADTSFTIAAVGQHNIMLNVCNDECGCVGSTRTVTVQELYPSFTLSPYPVCLGTSIDFSGSAVILPAVPPTNPNVTLWQWNFGDPGSGASNTATGQNVSHTFVGPGTTFTVTLTAFGTCGPEVTTQIVNLRPLPIVSAGLPQTVCEGQDVNLTATTTNATAPITYNWIGPGDFSCTNCASTVLSNLLPGGPYNISIDIVDSLGCTADTTVDVTVNPKPIIFAGTDLDVCQWDSVALDATTIIGTPPLSYTWTPSGGLSNDTIPNPFAYISSPITYCVTAVDAIGCTSDPSCINIGVFQKPEITPTNPSLCATSPLLLDTFTVNGAGPGSGYFWSLSSNYSMIIGATADSSDIYVSFPPGVAATYSFTVIVDDAFTGCRDTVTTTFTVTPGLSMTITGPASTCQGDPVTLTASGATLYSWTANPPYVFGDSTLAVQTVTPLVTTTFTVIGVTGSCSQLVTHSVTMNPKPVSAIAPIPPFCGCDTILLNGAGSTPGMTYLWGSLAGTTISNNTTLSASMYTCTNDVVTLRVTDPATGCYKDSSFNVTSKPSPNAVATVIPNAICNGVTTLIILDGNGSNMDPGTTYNWSSNSPGLLITDTTAFITNSTVSTSTVFYFTVTDSLGCDSTTSDTVNIYPLPVLTATDPFICTSDPLLQSVLSVNGATAGSGYNWTTIPSCVSPSSTTLSSETFDFSTCGPGVYNFNVIVNDIGTGCIDTLAQSVTVVSGVVLTVSPDLTLCEGDTALLFASGANTYSWNSGQTTDTISVNGLTASGSPYSFTVTGTIGTCSTSKTIIVSVNPIPVTQPITGPASVCATDTGLVYVVSPPGGNYTWSINGGTIVGGQNTDSITVNWDSAGTGTLTVIDTNSFGCPGLPQTLTVTINPLPDSSTVIQGPSPVCENSTQTYFVIPNAGSTYYWFVSGGTIVSSSTSSVVSIQWGAAGLGTISIYEVNATNCIGPVLNHDVIINPRPLPVALSGNQTVCDSSTEIYTLPYTSGSTYNWSVVGGNVSQLSSNLDSATVFWAGSGTSTISVSETNSFGCTSDTTTMPVSVFPKPQATALPDSGSICQNNAFQIFGSANNGTVHWYSSGSGVFSDTTIASPTYTPGAADTGYVTLTMVLSGFPCENDTADVVVYVSQAPVVTLTGTLNTLCYGQSDTLTATGGGSYLWMPGGLTDSVIIVQPIVSTDYVVTVSNAFNCTTNDTLHVTVIPPGIPDAGSDLLICLGDSALLNGTQQNAGGLIWSTLGDGSFSPANNLNAVYYLPGPTDTTSGYAQIVLTTTGACLNLSDTMIVAINSLPTIYAGRDTVITSGPGSGTTLPLAPLVTNSPTVIWTTTGTGTFSPSDTSLNAIYTPSDADYALDSVILTVTTTGGCITVNDQLKIEFTPFVIPNIITPNPNTPGYNDYFEIKNLPPHSQLKIWDRWGLLVFVTGYYRNDWDAALLKSDIYYYLLTLEDGKDYHGWVKVVR